MEDGFEQVELISPKQALEEAGAKTYIISPQRDKVKGWAHTKWGQEFPVDVAIEQANASDYEGLVTSRKPDDLPSLTARWLRKLPKANTSASRFSQSVRDNLRPCALTMGLICKAGWSTLTVRIRTKEGVRIETK